MTSVLMRRLEGFVPLSPEDRKLVDDIVPAGRVVDAHQDVARQGRMAPTIHHVLEGFACRYKMLPDGGRQICSLMVPGDFCSMGSLIVGTADHSLGTLSRCRIAAIEPEAIWRMLDRPALSRAMWWSAIVSEAIQREWLVNVAKRTAEERLAHLFCEMHLRLHMVDLVRGGGFEFPLTQSEIADVLGLSVVHVSRTLKILRDQSLMDFRDKRVIIHDLSGLQSLAQFDATYLHLGDTAHAG